MKGPYANNTSPGDIKSQTGRLVALTLGTWPSGVERRTGGQHGRCSLWKCFSGYVCVDGAWCELLGGSSKFF